MNAFIILELQKIKRKPFDVMQSKNSVIKKIGAVFLLLNVSISSASLTGTYVPATPSNTVAAIGGTTWFSASDLPTDNLWTTYNHSSFRNSSFKASATETVPEIRTKIDGLVPGLQYRIRMVYIAGSTVQIQAKLTNQANYVIYTMNNGIATGDYAGEYMADIGTAYADYLYGSIDVQIKGVSGMMTFYLGLSYTVEGDARVIGYPAYPLICSNDNGGKTPNEICKTARMKHVSCGNIGSSAADCYAQSAFDEGFNVVVSAGGRYLFKDDPSEVLPANLDTTNTFSGIIQSNTYMANACHLRGLQFWLHQTATMCSQGLIAQHPLWAAIDISTGNPYTTGYGTEAVCINNDEFLNAFQTRLNQLVVQTGADGLMLDEIQFFGDTLCGCSSCRQKFTADTGYSIPYASGLGSWLYHFVDNVSYREWLKWRRTKVKAIMTQITSSVRTQNPDIVITNYIAENSGNYPYYGAGWTLNDITAYGDNIGYECEPPGFRYTYYYPLSIMEGKYLKAVSERMNTGCWTLCYDHLNDPGNHTWNWFVSMSQGSQKWFMASPNLPEQRDSWKLPVQWECRYEKILANSKTIANIGVLFSLDSRDRNPRMTTTTSWLRGISSTCGALTDWHVPYRVILDEDMTAAALSNKIKTIVLFNVGSMSQSQMDAVRTFVYNGGTLIASAETSLYDENGLKRANFGLSDLLGCSYQSEITSANQLVISSSNPVTRDVVGTFSHNHPFMQVNNVAGDATIYGTMMAGASSYPGILCRSYGSGKVVYFTGHPELHYLYSYYGTNEIVPGQHWTDSRIETYGQIIRNAAIYNNDSIPLIVENLPKEIVAEVYDHTYSGLSGIQVHLANFLGARISTGIVPEYHVTFPDANGYLPNPQLPITVRVKATDINAVYLVSPDFDATISLDFTVSSGYTSVSIPVFYRYCIIYFNRGDNSEILSINGMPVMSIPPPKKLVTAAKSILRPSVADSTAFPGSSPSAWGGLANLPIGGWYQNGTGLVQAQTYCTFDISGIQAPQGKRTIINTADLKLWCVNSSPAAEYMQFVCGLYAIDMTNPANNWTENTLSWGNRPVLGPQVDANWVSPATYTLVQCDLKSYMQSIADSNAATVSFAVKSIDQQNTANWFMVGSREWPSSLGLFAPSLIINYEYAEGLWGDLNGDGSVNFIDFARFAEVWLTDNICGLSADMDMNCSVDYFDLKKIEDNWLK